MIAHDTMLTVKNKVLVTIAVVMFVALGSTLFLQSRTVVQDSIPEVTPTTFESPSANLEEAELTGFNFILNFITSAPPANEEGDIAMISAYEMLSEKAKDQVALDTLSRDLAMFVGVQDVPDEGASVEDLQIVSNSEVILTVGLNFSGGRALRDITLIIEDGVWKVDSVDPVTESSE